MLLQRKPYPSKQFKVGPILSLKYIIITITITNCGCVSSNDSPTVLCVTQRPLIGTGLSGVRFSTEAPDRMSKSQKWMGQLTRMGSIRSSTKYCTHRQELLPPPPQSLNFNLVQTRILNRTGNLIQRKVGCGFTILDTAVEADVMHECEPGQTRKVRYQLTD